MAVFFWHLVKCYLSSYTPIHWTSNFLQITRKTRPFLTGHPVLLQEFLAGAPEVGDGDHGHGDQDPALPRHGRPHPTHAGVEGIG